MIAAPRLIRIADKSQFFAHKSIAIAETTYNGIEKYAFL